MRSNKVGLLIIAALALSGAIYAANMQFSPPEPPKERRFELTMTQFDIYPRMIKVRKGEIVALVVIGTYDKEPEFKEHGLAISGYDITASVQDKPVEVRFVADKAGSFHIFCYIMCGTEHHKMFAKLLVE